MCSTDECGYCKDLSEDGTLTYNKQTHDKRIQEDWDSITSKNYSDRTKPTWDIYQKEIVRLNCGKCFDRSGSKESLRIILL